MKDSEQLKALTAALTADAAVTPLILCDEEGGTVARLMNTVGTTRIGSMYSYREEGTETAFRNARTIGEDLRDHGVNTDLAPVADVWSNPANTVIHTRAYSDDFAQAAQLVASAVEGFHAGGVACTLKHFPGHGDTTEDSHNGAAFVHKTLEELREEELLPFRAGIEAGADLVMMGHLTVPALDERPAPFSPLIVTELLRGELGFTGPVITDALAMGALQEYDGTEAVLLALAAGVDLLLCPSDPGALVAELAAAVENGQLSEARVEESVLRILRMKEARGLLDSAAP
jgi:beta-N-acetylhexosaminidase